MKRWNSKESEKVENPKIDEFLMEVFNLYKKYNFSISHEDRQGAFEIRHYHPDNVVWLFNAHDETSREEKIQEKVFRNLKNEKL